MIRRDAWLRKTARLWNPARGRIVFLHWPVMIPDVSGAERPLSVKGFTGWVKDRPAKMMSW